jgi:hypothetical protein
MSNWEEETKVPLITSCKQAARLVSLSCERTLTWREDIVMHVHLWMCKTCNRYRKQVRALRGIFVRHREVLDNTPPSGCECLNACSRQRMKDTIQAQQ